ncbi:MAG: NAD+ synthetase [Chlorobi bacterium OLB4]|jgi:Predicted amidohydrolase|nr:MAG: NAD+ synthetase [Chlorobi bacterium OLB4]MBW7854721.1 acyltransferase [Ignavibacteria bacterium]OQY78242.1 MAG: hypothetical protein B6D43_03770 [Ignavibacteriales bacterium UTCHB1]
MKVAVAQINSVLGDFEKNINHHAEFCQIAISENADVIVFPELSLTGYSLKDLNYAIALNPGTTDKLDRLKKLSQDISIICGFAEMGEDYGIYNSAMYIESGEIKFTHRKNYPPTYGLFEEYRYFSSGDVCKAHDTKLGRVGLLVCEDLWHISLPYLQALDGAQVLFGIAASPTRLTADTRDFKNDTINSEQHRVFSRLLSVYFVFSNRVGYEDGINFWGGSEIIDPFGRIISKAKLFEEDIIYAEINRGEIMRARQQARHFLDEDINLTINNLVRIRESRNK